MDYLNLVSMKLDEGKHQAEVKYKLITKSYNKDKLIEMLNRYINDITIKKMEKKYIPYCSSWLSQKRYLDFEDYEMQIVATNSSNSNNGNWFDDLDIKLG